MHPFFEPLEEHELALLLTTLMIAGGKHVAIFAGLPAKSSQRLTAKAQTLLAIPAAKRIPLLTRELKNMLNVHGLCNIERMDPSWIVWGLHGQSPRMIAVILLDLPAAVVRSVLRHLPPTVREQLPPKQEISKLAKTLRWSIRQLFEARFVPMPAAPRQSFAFTDLVHLDKKDLFYLVRDLGLIELGQAFVSMGRLALSELCRRLPQADAIELIEAVKTASRVDLPESKHAQHFLSRVVANFTDTEQFFLRAGLWRLAKAYLPEFLHADNLDTGPKHRIMAQRLPHHIAEIFLGYLEKAREEKADLPDPMIMRLQDAILVRVVVLSRQGAIAPQWGDSLFAYHDRQAAELALNETLKAAQTAFVADKDDIN